tara:strand:+ start:3334 stop:5022 length:1689 start_codon:yes stop_codon:yes gene_type:complete
MEEPKETSRQILGGSVNNGLSENWFERLSVKVKGRSHDMVRLGIVVIVFQILIFTIWKYIDMQNEEHSLAPYQEIMTYLGLICSVILMIWCFVGILVSINVHPMKREMSKGTPGGLLLSIGGLTITGFSINYELMWLGGVGTAVGGIGILFILHGLGLLPREHVAMGMLLAVGSGLAVIVNLTRPETSLWLLGPLLMIGLGMAGLHHNRIPLVGFVIGCYLSGVGSLYWWNDPVATASALLGGGLPLLGSGSLFLIRRSDSEGMESIFQEGEEALDDGDISKALEIYEKLLRVKQREGGVLEDQRMWAGKARALLALKQPDRALTYFSMAQEIAPMDDELWFEKGRIYQKLGHWAGAAKCYQRTTELQYIHPEAWLSLAKCKEKLGKNESAKEAYRMALEQGGDKFDTMLGQGRILAKQGDIKESLKTLEMVIEIEPDNPRPYMVRGDIYFNIEDYERAETLGYSIAVQKQPDLVKGWKNLYKVYQAQDKVDMMIMTISRILEFDAENEEALWNRSELNYRLKKYTEAIADIHTLISVNPQHKKARQFKALILEKINEKGWN